LLLALFGVVPTFAKAAETPSPVTTITIVRKDGHRDGVARMTVSGSKSKPRSITKHAMQAWPVRDGQGALILVVQKKQYLLRYYDLDSGRRRTLGAVPFSHGSLQETKLSHEGWAFALSGKDLSTGQPLTLVGSTDAMPGLLPRVTCTTFSAGSLTCTTHAARQTVTVANLLGTDLNDM